MSPAPDLDGLSNADLKRLVEELLGRVTALERTVAAQREEIARLKDLKGRPTIKPGKSSGMDPHTSPPGSGHKPGRRGPKATSLTIHEERVMHAAAPAGSRFKGYEDFLVQDLVVRSHGIRIRRERWLTPDGRTIVAPLPDGIIGHFGPDLHRYVLALYHQGQLTIPRLVEHLTMLGVLISKRQVVRLLSDASGLFRGEAMAVLQAGLRSARWISVDDTGARHQGRNGTCTQIGNDHFTWFGTTTSKSRLNFLELLRAGHTDYVINADALAYLRRRALPQPLIARLAHASETDFDDARPGSVIWNRWRCPADPTRSIPSVWPPKELYGQHQGARLFAGHGDRQRRCRPVRGWRARVVLGACRAADPSARHLHGSSACGPEADAAAGVVVLPGSEALSPGTDPPPTNAVASAL
jgi:hypothetical protein